MLPKIVPDKLPGAVCAQYIRCSKPNCKCARGELHGPYWYRFWRDEEGRLHKQYVKKADLEAVREACEATREEQRQTASLLAKGSEVIRRWNGDKVEQSEDPIERLLERMRLHATIHRLISLACGEFGSPEQWIRAACILEAMRVDAPARGG